MTLVTYIEIINEAKALIQAQYEPKKVEAITVYLALVLNRCADRSCRLARWDSSRTNAQGGSAQHALNLMWNYPETSGASRLWQWCAETVATDYSELCSLIGIKPGSIGIPGIEQHNSKSVQLDAVSTDNLTHISDNSVDIVVTDPPYYSTIQYAELSNFFFVWLKRTLGDILPELFLSELTDKDREVRVDGGYYAPHLSYRTGRETFASPGSQIFLGLLFPFAHVDVVMTGFMYGY